MSGISELWTTWLGVYYLAVTCVAFYAFSKRKPLLQTIFLTVSYVFVSREYYEIPIFVYAFLGWFGHSYWGFASQALTIGIFLVTILFSPSRKPNRYVVLLLTSGFVPNFFLLIQASEIAGLFARIIGFGAMGVVYHQLFLREHT